VVAGSPADKAWLKSWDIIIEANWIPLTSWVSTKDILKDKLPWEKVTLKILTQSWEAKTVEIVLSDR
jgi:S1-C subfamily serine protease